MEDAGINILGLCLQKGGGGDASVFDHFHRQISPGLCIVVLRGGHGAEKAVAEGKVHMVAISGDIQLRINGCQSFQATHGQFANVHILDESFGNIVVTGRKYRGGISLGKVR